MEETNWIKCVFLEEVSSFRFLNYRVRFSLSCQALSDVTHFMVINIVIVMLCSFAHEVLRSSNLQHAVEQWHGPFFPSLVSGKRSQRLLLVPRRLVVLAASVFILEDSTALLWETECSLRICDLPLLASVSTIRSFFLYFPGSKLRSSTFGYHL